jgi:HEAT repeat protein/energy-coupling factor transporter ATP-binding protein EcfA2
MNVNGFPALVWALAIYAITELLLDVAKKTPLWLPRQLLGPVRRLWGELCYLRALVNDPDLNRWAYQYVTLRAIKARPAKGTAEPKPLLSLLRNHMGQGQQVVVLGEPGAGKTTTLEALAYHLAQRAYRVQVAVWAVFLGLIVLLMTFHSPRWALLLLAILLFDFVFRCWPLPLFIELRHYEGGAVEDFLKKTVAGRVGGQALSERLRSYVERGRLMWLLDGVNEVRGETYESALDGWRECFTPGHYFARAQVVFTSRTGENPADRLGLKEVLEVLDLDDGGVRDFLHAYGSEAVDRDFAALERNNMLGEQGLGRNPYWLKMMVESGLYTRNRGALFENFARRLIQRELDRGRVQPQPSVVPVDDELDALGRLAYVMSDAGQVGLALNQAELTLAKWLEDSEWKPRQVLDEGEAATLMRLSRPENRAEFAHQLVQEFFAAYALRLQFDEALRRADALPWWETLLILSGLLEEHTIEGSKKVGRHDNYCQFVRRVLGDGRDVRRLFLAAGLLRSVDKPDRALEHQVTAALAESLRQGATSAHKQAAVDLARIAGDEVVEALGGLLQGDDRTVKEGAVQILEEIESRKAAQALVASLGDKMIASQVTKALVAIAEPAVKPLIRALRDQDSEVRQRAVWALVQLRELAVEPLISALQDKDSWVRQKAVEALERIGEPAVKPLIGALQDKDSRVRRRAAEALEKIGDARAVGSLIGALRDEHNGVRWSAAEALGKIGEPAVEPLIEALRDKDSRVRQKVAEALGGIADARAVGPLIGALRDKDSWVRRRAAEALEKIRGPAVGPLIGALWDEDSRVRRRAAEALGEIGDARAVGPLIGALRDKDSRVRQKVAEALGKIGEPAVEPLIGALRDENRLVRRRAGEALGEIRDARAVEPLIGALRDRDSWVRRRAAEALEKIGDPRPLPHLRRVAREDEGKTPWGTVADAAREAIRRIRIAQRGKNGQADK